MQECLRRVIFARRDSRDRLRGHGFTRIFLCERPGTRLRAPSATICAFFPVTLQSRVQKLLQFCNSSCQNSGSTTIRKHIREQLLQSTQAHLKSLYQEFDCPGAGFAQDQTCGFCSARLASTTFRFMLYMMGNLTWWTVSRFSYAPSASIYALCQQKPSTLRVRH